MLRIRENPAAGKPRCVDRAQSPVQQRVAAARVGPDVDQIAIALVARQHLFEKTHAIEMFVVDQCRHRSRNRRFDVDRRVMPGFRERAGQHDMTVENRAGRVGDGVLLVVTLGQHRIERGDRAAAGRAVARALNECRQLGEDRRRIAFRRGRLADRERDLALCHRVTRERVHQQQHMLALVAEIFGERGGVSGALHAQQRRDVGRRGDDDRTREPVFAEDLLDEFLHFAAPLADEADHDDFGTRVARHLAEQHRFTDARAGEQTHALTASDGEQSVDRTHAYVEHPVDRFALQRVDRRGRERGVGACVEFAEAVERAPRSVHDAPEHAPAHRQALGAGERIGHGRAFARKDACARQQAGDFGRRHEEQALRGETDHFGFGHRVRAAGRQLDHAFGSDAEPQAHRLQHEAGRAREPPAGGQRPGDRIALAQAVQPRAPGGEMRIGGQRGVGRRERHAQRGRGNRASWAREHAGIDGGRLGRAFGAERSEGELDFERRHAARAQCIDGALGHHWVTLPSAAATRSQRDPMDASISPLAACARQPPRSIVASVRTLQPSASSSSFK